MPPRRQWQMLQRMLPLLLKAQRRSRSSPLAQAIMGVTAAAATQQQPPGQPQRQRPLLLLLLLQTVQGSSHKLQTGPALLRTSCHPSRKPAALQCLALWMQQWQWLVRRQQQQTPGGRACPVAAARVQQRKHNRQDSKQQRRQQHKQERSQLLRQQRQQHQRQVGWQMWRAKTMMSCL